MVQIWVNLKNNLDVSFSYVCGFGNLVQIKVIFFLPMVFFVAGCSYLLKFLVNIVVCCDGVLGE